MRLIVVAAIPSNAITNNIVHIVSAMEPSSGSTGAVYVLTNLMLSTASPTASVTVAVVVIPPTPLSVTITVMIYFASLYLMPLKD